MAITQRGEIDATIGGETRTLCLTLGALAERVGGCLGGALVGRAVWLPGAGVRGGFRRARGGGGGGGGGNAITDDDLARFSIEGGLKGAAEIAARLLKATFGEAA